MQKSFFFLFGLIFLLASCQPEEPTAGTFRLLPSPQSFSLQGPSKIDPSTTLAYALHDGAKLPPVKALEKQLASQETSNQRLVILLILTLLGLLMLWMW